jgi:hypothetical protein
MEFRGTLQSRNFFYRHILDHHCFFALISCVRSTRIFNQEQLDGIQLNGFLIPIVGVLCKENIGAGNPLTDIEGTVADIGLRLCSPCIAVLLNRSLVYRTQYSESSQFVKITAGMRKLNHEGCIIRC